MPDIAWLIPAHNDEWTLDLCLESLHRAGPVWQVHVLENGSTDRTREVADWWASRSGLIHAHHHPVPLDNADRRNELLDRVDARHVCFIDADMVLIEGRAGDIVDMAADHDCATRRFRFCRPYGDLAHIAREADSDRCCHQYADLKRVEDFVWRETPAGFGVNNHRGGPASDRVLFWHLNAVRPDYRLVNRDLTRDYFAGDLDVQPAGVVSEMLREEIHKRALEWLHGGDWTPIEQADVPPLPDVLARRPRRFEVRLENGRLIDRIDHGWTPPWERENA